MTAPSRKSRTLKCAAILLVGLLLAGAAEVPILRGVASFLIVEDPLRPAAAIVPLGGRVPFREIEAAKIYRAGLAPVVILVRTAPTQQTTALQQLGITKVPEWELSRQVLVQQGVPASAILIPKDEGIGTLEELRAAWDTLQQRAWSKEHGAGGRRTEVPSTSLRTSCGQRAADATTSTNSANTMNANNAVSADHAINAQNALPVILVTSKYHTRRTRLTWNYVTDGRSQAIVRAASGDPFDPDRWWQTRSYALSVVREYLGLANYYAGFPVAP